ncbi:MAG: N-acetylmuramoyl-L-alanine amidase [Pontixanthobacter sp.]
MPVPHMGRNYVVRLLMPDVDAPLNLPAIAGPQDKTRPLVVIDAGHGGRDPGASGSGYLEKRVVLQLARALRGELMRRGGIRVAMTRDGDEYVRLSDRPEIARRLGADLFISIHADSSGEESGVKGASIYTLSEDASSQAAARFAERENRSNALNGVVVDRSDQQVNDILVALSQRRVQEHSAELAGLIVREGKGALEFHPQSRRSAALAVLRAPDVPAVLFESGFITNEFDAERLTSDVGREQFANTLARAIAIYFARQSRS